MRPEVSAVRAVSSAGVRGNTWWSGEGRGGCHVTRRAWAEMSVITTGRGWGVILFVPSQPKSELIIWHVTITR